MENIQPILEKLATGLNVKVEFLWGVLVSGQLPLAIGNLVAALIAWGVCFLIIKLNVNHYFYNKEDFDWQDLEGVWVISSGALASIGFFIATIVVISIIPKVAIALASPEFSALQSILDLIK